jgi:mannose-6-phosphate isomerase
MLYPLTFGPIFKERVWGGRNLERLYKKPLPSGLPIGESWEISDRPGDVSVIANGPLAGKDLHWLMKHHAKELLGDTPSANGRFPLLIKILDAEETLSLQVHPPAHKASELGGEPKTEMWYIADAKPSAELYVGLKRGVTREVFERKIRAGEVADCFHRVSVKPGDVMFLPSGRVHAIGGGLVIFEVQQNSDTTYRVFDWNRLGLDGKPRDLHIHESLASIDFEDFEPAVVRAKTEPMEGARSLLRFLINCELFEVNSIDVQSHLPMDLTYDKPVILGVVDGRILVTGGGESAALKAGEFCLVPANLKYEARSEGDSKFLCIIAK